jgi:N-methylhydantoinase A
VAIIGVDVGGTFTDLILYDEESAEVRVAKELTTPAAPDRGVVNAVNAGVPDDLLRSAEFFLHGTTVGLNALLEREGAVLGLVTTRGFRDVLEIRRADRAEMYNVMWSPPPPIVPRRLRLPASERVTADGTLHTPLDEEDIRAAVRVFAEEGVTSVAVAFLHSYANPANELAAEAAMRACGFTGEISLSHRISGEYREYERSSTTVVDSYVRPRVGAYLRRLADGLTSKGFGGGLLVTRSGGGAMSFAEAEERPVETILSGPVAGAQGAAELARTLDLRDVITADVGGTSFDTCIIRDYQPELLYEGSVIGLPLQIPWIDVRSIGAGGGSIAYVDAGGLLRVGPESAGADPGPAAYGRGGTRPTVTDAALALGMFAEGNLAGGVKLDAERARDALAPVGEAIKRSPEQVAEGVLTVVTAQMADAIREITIDRGRDPRDAALMAFGGAGPLVGTLVARELDISTVVIPPYAGNFSAWGLLGADLTRTSSRTRITRLGPAGVAQSAALLDELLAEFDEDTGIAAGLTTQREGAFDMRYAGQEHTLSVPVTLADGGGVVEDDAMLAQAFRDEYERVFAQALEEPIEIVNVRAAQRGSLPKIDPSKVGASAHVESRPPGSCRAYSFAEKGWLDFAVHARESLSGERALVGPAIVLEGTTTTYVDTGFEVAVDPCGALIIRDVLGRDAGGSSH